MGIYKECMMCHKIYEGAYKPSSEVSHGVCKDPDCNAAYIMLSFGCDEGEALSTIENLVLDDGLKKSN